jgi:hypothetical protein
VASQSDLDPIDFSPFSSTRAKEYIATSATTSEYHDDGGDDDEGIDDDDIGGGALTGQDGSVLSTRRDPSFLC